MRIRFAALWLVVAIAEALAAPQSSAKPLVKPPYEITKDRVEIEVAADGTYIETQEMAARVLDARGIETLHERKLAYTQSFEAVQVAAAYTLKADGKRINVPPGSYLSGFGQSSQAGFQDLHIVSIFFPNLEVGDSVVLVTVHRQLVPWFTGQFDMRADFSRAIAAHDVHYAVTAPDSLPLKIDAVGMQGGDEERSGGKKRWVWTYANDIPVSFEDDAVSETDFGPHVRLTTFADYAAVAAAYRERIRGHSDVTPEITTLAEQLTAGIADKRAQANKLYDWVSTHIAYVGIVLGAGGFTPHDAKDVLANRFGDCKDHVEILEALLKAKGIESMPVLIEAGTHSYKFPGAASPHDFDHVITYLPAFDLYLDSTAQLAPFGVLPYEDVGKPVLNVTTGAVARTPVATSANSIVNTTSEITVDADGNAQGHSKTTASGAYGVVIRSMMQSVASGKEGDFFRNVLGPGADGTLERGDPQALAEPYVWSATYSVPNALTFPGPGALPPSLVLKPFYFTALVGGNLPATRNSDYLCHSFEAVENTKVNFPAGTRLIAIPDSQSLKTDGISLQIDYDRTDPHAITFGATLKVDHPEAVCTPDYYARVHGSLVKMTNALHQEIIYRGPRGQGQ